METSKTADSALALLLAVGDHGRASATELSRALELNRTVTHRLLATLHARGFVRRDGDIYLLGPVLARLGEHVAPTLRAVAQPVMERLSEQLNETVVLSVPDDVQAVVVGQALGRRHMLRVEHTVGSRHPMQLGASGRALLAFQDETVVRRVLRREKDAESYRAQLAEIRRVGYAVSHDELSHGVHGLAAPVLEPDGRALAGMAVIAPVQRAEVLRTVAEPLMAAVAAVSEQLFEAGPRTSHGGG